MPPLVSICMPTLNARRFLEPRMESILTQTLTDWELIVCDSFSDDGTWEFLQSYKSDPRVRLYQVPREGLYAGWNECLRRATGAYVYVATADDTCKPELLEKMVGALEQWKVERGKWNVEREERGDEESPKHEIPKPEGNPKRGEWPKHKTGNWKLETGEEGMRAWSVETGTRPQGATKDDERRTMNDEHAFLPFKIAVCNFDYIDENSKVIEPPLPPAGAFYGDDRYRPHVRSGYKEFLVHLLIGTSWTTMTTVLFPRALLEKTGLFRTDCGALADRFWAYKSALFADTVVVPETLATWRQHAEQGSSPFQKRDMRARRQLWRATVETLDECEPFLPEAWKRMPHWREALLRPERKHYYDLLRLDRTTLRYRPLTFLRGALSAARLEPGYLLKRLAVGLAWEPDHRLTETEYCERLIRGLDEGDEGRRTWVRALVRS